MTWERRKPLRRGTPLNPGKGLQPGAPLERRTPLQGGGGLRGVPLQRSSPMPRTPSPPRRRPTPVGEERGAAVPTELREMILARAGWSCDRCAKYLGGQPYSLQHRKARQAGGRRGANTPGNLILLCGSATSPGGCHHWAEHVDRAEAYRLRFAIRGEVEDPDETPVYRHLAVWVVPGDGVWVPSAPPEDQATA